MHRWDPEMFKKMAHQDLERHFEALLPPTSELLDKQAAIKALLAASALVERLGSVPEEHLKTITEACQGLVVQLGFVTQ